MERYRKWGIRAWGVLWALLIAAHLFPIRFGSLRLLMLGSLALLWIGGMALFWQKRWTRITVAAIGLLICLPFLLPGRTTDTNALRAEYVHSLRRYRGTVYVWGGESSRGIDCSGLVRVGLIDADFNRGVSTLNPALMREGLALWWYDCSADALKQEYRQNSRILFSTPSLNALDYTRILPGDFAVTESGLHTLAYIGDQTWIEADPKAWRVITVTTPDNSIWFTEPMKVLRWRQLQ